MQKKHTLEQLEKEKRPKRQVGLNLLYSIIISFFFLFINCNAFAQDTDDSTDRLLAWTLSEMSLEELMNVEVISVSNQPEKLVEVASAIQVITSKDIERSGVTRLPEALSLASNLQVLQTNSHSWSITARGFGGLPSSGGIIANKLLVMNDGRSIYTPLFGGVFWDSQNMMLNDVDRIEVVSGPGGTLWGANAVNGVINIISKSSRETQGLYVSATAGSFLKDMAEVRFGGKSTSVKNLYFRLYGQRFDQNSAILSGQASDTISNQWNFTQGGFRMDYYITDKTTIVFQGDVYLGDANKETTRSINEGQNLLTRVTTNFSEKSNLTVQFYMDHVNRRTPQAVKPFTYDLITYHSDVRHRFAIGQRQNLLWGVGARIRRDEASSSLKPLSREMNQYTAFFQDEITILPDKLVFTVGSKVLHNVFTGVEYQPSARLSYTPGQVHTVWSAVSRVVRTPSRFDADLVTVDDFKSEKVLAYELGYRVRPLKQLSFSFSAFYNNYDDLRSIDSANIDSDPELELALANSQIAESWGFEIAYNYILTDWWRIRGGYNYFDKEIKAINNLVHPLSVLLESVESKHQFMLQSVLDLPKNFQFDVVTVFRDKIPEIPPSREIPMTFSLDARIAWKYKFMVFSLVGQNITKKEQTETGLSLIPRSIYGKIVFNL